MNGICPHCGGEVHQTERCPDALCGQVTRDGRVLVDGLEFSAGEAHFGGIVVQP